jgi:hypothetical protein
MGKIMGVPVMISTAQIGKCSELLVQYKLLPHGIESALLAIDAGGRIKEILTLQVTARRIQISHLLLRVFIFVLFPIQQKGRQALILWHRPRESPPDNSSAKFLPASGIIHLNPATPWGSARKIHNPA